MLAADAPSSWIGVLWFGLFAVAGLFIAWWLRLQLATGHPPRRSSPGQRQVAMWGAALIGAANLALALRELIRAVW